MATAGIFFALGVILGLLIGFVAGWIGRGEGVTAARAEWSRKSDALQREHEAEIAQLHGDYAAEIARLRPDHAAEVIGR